MFKKALGTAFVFGLAIILLSSCGSRKRRGSRKDNCPKVWEKQLQTPSYTNA